MAFQPGRNLVHSVMLGGKNYHLIIRYDKEFMSTYDLMFIEGDWQASNPQVLWQSPPLSDTNWSRNEPKAYLQFFLNQLNSFLVNKFTQTAPPDVNDGPPPFDNTPGTWILILEYWLGKMRFQITNNIPQVMLL